MPAFLDRAATSTSLAAPPPLLAPGRWAVVPGSTRATFTAADVLRRPVVGELPVLRGHVVVDAAGSPVAVDAELDLAAVTTGSTRRDRDLRGRSFFDAATEPVLRFTAGPATGTAEGWRLLGSLRLKGAECPLPVQVVAVGPGRVRATAEVDRYALGIRVPRLLVGRTVEIAVDAVLSPPR